jgi:hypothetical protein
VGRAGYHIWNNTSKNDKKEKTCLLVDKAIPDDSNVKTKETEKLNKYKDLEIKVSRSWKVRAKTLPVITAALATNKEVLDQNLQLLPGNLLTTELQKITLMSTAHIIRDGVNCFDLLLRFGFSRRPPPNN